jgi:hypothetical protein
MYLISGDTGSRSSNIIHSRDVSKNHLNNFLKALKERSENQEKIDVYNSPHGIRLYMWGVSLSLAEALPIAFRQQVVLLSVSHNGLSAPPVLHRISTENSAWEVQAN